VSKIVRIVQDLMQLFSNVMGSGFLTRSVFYNLLLHSSDSDILTYLEY